MSEVEVPRFLEVPESIWVRCEEVRKLSEMETACLVSEVGGEERLVIVEPTYCQVEKKLVRALKVGTAPSNASNWLVDVPSGQRLLIAEDKVAHGSPA